MSTTSLEGAGQSSWHIRVPVWLWTALGVYAVLLLAGDRLLNDPDTFWQLKIGQWIWDNGAVPRTDAFSFTMHGQPWVSTQWLAQVLYAGVYALAGWAGPVILAAAAIATAFGLLARFLTRRLPTNPTLVLVLAAVVLAAPHLLARPHALALPVMVAWVAGLIAAADRRDAPSWWLLALMTLWANLHGGFVLGLALIGPIALDAIWHADASARRHLVLRWAMFALAALAASCLTPYGWESLLASRKILSLGQALPLIIEWRPADFSKLGAFELCLLLALGVALLKGLTLPPLRIALMLGLLHLALASARNAEVLALLGPLVLATPLAQRFGRGDVSSGMAGPRPSTGMVAGAVVAIVATIGIASLHRFTPSAAASPVAAIAALKDRKASRVLNEYGFGGYMIAAGIAPFIDGRTELYGETFVVQHDRALALHDIGGFFKLLDAYKIDATLLHPATPAAQLLDRLDGWQRVFGDDIAVVHVRKAGAADAAPSRINSAPK